MNHSKKSPAQFVDVEYLVQMSLASLDGFQNAEFGEVATSTENVGELEESRVEENRVRIFGHQCWYVYDCFALFAWFCAS